MKTKMIALALFLATAPLFAAAYLKFDGIQGESKDAAHTGWIELVSYSWGVSNSGAMAYGSGGGEGKASFHDLSFVHKMDKASPALQQAAAIGKHFPVVTLDSPGVKYVLDDVYIAGVQMGRGGDGAPIETVKLLYAKDEMHNAPVNPNPVAGITSPTRVMNPVQANATLNGGAVVLQSIHLVGQTQAIIVVCDVSGGQAVAALGRQGRTPMPTLTIKANPKQPGGAYMTFTFTNVLVSSYSAAAGGCNQMTLNFTKGPSAGY